MRLLRFEIDGRRLQGTVDGDRVALPDGRSYALDAVSYLPPVEPQKILGLALNYADHATELGLAEPEDPAIFFKPQTSLTGHLSSIVYPHGATHCHYETELAVVIGRECRKVTLGSALDYVSGYTVANDFTCRDFVKNTFRPPVRAKGFDSFCPLGPFLVSADEVGDPGNLDLTTRVNGVVRQEGSTRHLIHSVPEIIAYLASFMTLMPGDVILTGTPKGISPVYPGDVISSEVASVGILENRVVAEVLDAEPSRRKI